MMQKTAFISGVTAGIGAASARRFAREGWKIVGTGRRRERLDALAAELGDALLPLQLDMQDRHSIEGAGDSLPEGFRHIDLLINNAGLAPPMEPLQDTELAPSLQAIETNISGLVILTRRLLPSLIARKGGIIN